MYKNQGAINIFISIIKNSYNTLENNYISEYVINTIIQFLIIFVRFNETNQNLLSEKINIILSKVNDIPNLNYLIVEIYKDNEELLNNIPNSV